MFLYEYLIEMWNKIRFVPTLIYAFVSIWAIVGFLPKYPVALFYTISIVYALYCLLQVKSIDIPIGLLLIYIPLSLVFAQPDPIFHSWLRYGLFFVLMINVSPLFQSRQLRLFRKQCFLFILWGCVILGVGSFIGRFFNLNYMRLPDELDYGYDMINTAGLFAGLTIHSMMLGPIAGIGACFLVGKAVTTKNIWYWLLFIMSIVAVFFSASRAAVIAAVIGVVVTVYKQSKTNSRFIKICFIAFVLIASTYSIWNDLLIGVLSKHGIESSLTFDSRIDLWERGLNDFMTSPIFGVGFCATTNLEGITTSGRLESGSSWINVFSMLGIMGGLIVVAIFIRVFSYLIKRKDDFASVLSGIMVLFVIHMFAEGYIFAGGSFLAFLLWLSIGVTIDSSRYREEC